MDSQERIRKSKLCLVLTLLMVSTSFIVAAPTMAETGGVIDRLLPDPPAQVDLKELTMDDAAPAATCTDMTSWTVTGNVVCTNSNFIVYNYLRINAGATLTLEANSVLRLNVPSLSWSYMISVYGTLKVLNSTIQSNTATRYYGIYVYSGGAVRYEGATIRDTYYYGTYAWSVNYVKVNNTIMNNGNYYGLYIGSTSGYIMNSTISGYGYYGIYANSLSNFRINNNTLQSCQYGATLYTFNGEFFDNVVKSNSYYGIYLYNSAPLFANNLIQSNSQAGLYIYAYGLSLSNCTLINNGNRDFWIEAGGSKVDVHAINVEYGKAALDVNAWGGTSKLYVYWYANVTVKWLSDNSPAVDAEVQIEDRKGDFYPGDLFTDANGEIHKIPLLDFVEQKTGKETRSPHWVNATALKDDREIWNFTQMQVTKEGPNEAFEILDDVPPPLIIESPEDNILINGTNITLRGSTEQFDPLRPVTVTVKLKSSTWTPTVNVLGKFEQLIPLGKDGTHTIDVYSADWMGNKASGSLTVRKDTVNPPLEIISPKDGTLTNETTMAVTGTTEFGTNLTVNGVLIPVMEDGTWTANVKLKEGSNTITVKTIDEALNWIQKQRTIELDTIPPQLIVQEPMDGLKTNDRNLRVQGMVEMNSRVLINGAPVVVAGASFQTSYSMSEGQNVIFIDAIDLAGNHNYSMRTIYLDTVPPALELYEPSVNNLLVAQDTIELKGYVDPGAKLLIDRVDVGLEGLWSYDVELREGKNKITIEAMDEIGNKAQVGVTVIRDTTPPMLAVFSPDDEFTFSESQIWVEGSVEPGANLTINGEVTPTIGGVFSKTMDLTEGENKITLQATDKAGNVNTDVRTVFLDTAVSLTVDQEYAGQTVKRANITIRGETDPDAKVHINGEPVTVRADGKFAHEVGLIEGNNTILVQAHDEYGNAKQDEMWVTLKTPGGINSIGRGLGEDNSFIVWVLVLAIMITAIVAIVGHNVYSRKKERDAQMKAEADAQAEALRSDSTIYEQLYGSTPKEMPADQYAPSPHALFQSKGDTPSGNGIHTTEPLKITPEAMAALYDAEDKIHLAEAQGVVVTNAKRHLRLARQFAKRGNSDKTEIYSNKAIDAVEGAELGEDQIEDGGPGWSGDEGI